MGVAGPSKSAEVKLQNRAVRDRIAKRAARELRDGMVVNLGIGIPTLVADYLPADVKVTFHAENGVIGYGPTPQPGMEDPNLCNAGGLPITLTPGASYFDSAIAFAMIRRSLLDVTILGALQVSETGDLANWMAPGRVSPGMGGATELAQKTKRVIVVTEHLTRDGKPKILTSCTYPLTARQCVDLIITDLAVLAVQPDGLHLLEVAVGHSVEDVIAATEASVHVSTDLGTFGEPREECCM